MPFLRSLIFSVSMIASTFLTALLLLLCAPLPFAVRTRVARTYAAFIVGSLKIL